MSEETGTEVAVIEETKSDLWVALQLVVTVSALVNFSEPWRLKEKLKLNTYTNSDLTDLISNSSKVLGCLEIYKNSLEKLKDLAVKDLVSGQLTENGRSDY
jgi:hypothetical protein